jgi:hypothetical protein
VASDRKRDGAKRHDTFSSNAGHVRVSRKHNAAVVRCAARLLPYFKLSGCGFFKRAINVFKLLSCFLKVQFYLDTFLCDITDERIFVISWSPVKFVIKNVFPLSLK